MFQRFIQINFHSKCYIHRRKPSLVYGLLAETHKNIENKTKTKIQKKQQNITAMVVLLNAKYAKVVFTLF